jgi:hypothetical protein
MTTVALGFLPKPLMLAVDCLLPSVNLDPRLLMSVKYRQIRASIDEIGLIEPLAVTPVERRSGQHMVLDGHLRLQAVKALGHAAVACLVATDDELFTYNNQISRLSSIQEHLMVCRALDRGVTAAKLAKGLCIDISSVNKKRRLLEGICPEVATILKDRTFSADVMQVLRKMKATRQIECAELMVSANKVTATYARCLLAGTPSAMLTEGSKPLRPVAVSQEQLARMENEMASLHSQYKIAEQSHGEDMLNLTLARGYLIKLTDNPRAMRYMQAHYPEILAEFARIIEATSIEL